MTWQRRQILEGRHHYHNLLDYPKILKLTPSFFILFFICLFFNHSKEQQADVRRDLDLKRKLKSCHSLHAGQPSVPTPLRSLTVNSNSDSICTPITVFFSFFFSFLSLFHFAALPVLHSPFPLLKSPAKYLLPEVSITDYGKNCVVIDLDETLVHSSFKVHRTLWDASYLFVSKFHRSSF